MYKNLPTKYKSNIFFRIFRKFKSFFCKNDNSNIILNKDLESNDKLRYKDEIKVDEDIMNSYYNRKELIEMINNNPELLDSLSTDKLEKILKIFQEEILQLTNNK